MPPDSDNANQRAPALCRLGIIVNTHGVAGEVRLLPDNPDSTSLHAGQQITLRWPERSIDVCIRAVRPHKRFRLLVLDGYASVTAAEALVGAVVEIAADQLPKPAANEVYHHQLLGLRVWTDAGRALGVVESVMATGSNDVCVVRDGPREYLIPLIADVVRDIDVADGRMIITPIPGLLDL